MSGRNKPLIFVVEGRGSCEIYARTPYLSRSPVFFLFLGKSRIVGGGTLACMDLHVVSPEALKLSIIRGL